MNYYPYLDDKEFLKLVDKAKHKEQYVRIFVLTMDESEVLASIEGKATNGSINISGSSSLRRTGSLSIAVDPMGIQWGGSTSLRVYSNILEVQNLISLNKKIRVETGFKNAVEQQFGFYGDGRNYWNEYDTIWFPCGVFIIKSAQVSENNSGINISLTLNDKSAQLNGTCGGVFPATTLLSEEEVIAADGLSRIVQKRLIKDIIRSIVVEFGGENPGNIIIEDVPDIAKKVVKWTGEDSLYYVTFSGHKHFTNIEPSSNNTIPATNSVATDPIPLEQKTVTIYYREYVDSSTNSTEYEGGGMDDEVFTHYGFCENNEGRIVPVLYKTNVEASEVDTGECYYYIGRADYEGESYDHWRKIEIDGDSPQGWESSDATYLYTNSIVGVYSYTPFSHGQNIGYMAEPFVYPGDLEVKAGESVSTVLDKIKNTLGNYEWFYDIWGRFHFQQQKNFINESVTKKANELAASDYFSKANLGAPAYEFNDRSLVTSISVSPQYDNLKNDFVVWGTTKTVTGATKPIRYHVAFDDKPTKRTTSMEAIVYQDYRKLLAVIPLDRNSNFVEGSPAISISQTSQTLEYKGTKTVDGVTYYKYNNSIVCQIPENYSLEDGFRVTKVEDNFSNEQANIQQDIEYSLYKPSSSYDITWWLTVYAGAHISVNILTEYGTQDFCTNRSKYYYNKKDKRIYAWGQEKNAFRSFTNYKYCKLLPSDWRSELYFQGLEAKDKAFVQKPYAAELISEMPKYYNVLGTTEFNNINVGSTYTGRYSDTVKPENYEFALDLIESQPMSVYNIGRRSKVLTDNNVSCIYNTDIPNIYLVIADGDVMQEREWINQLSGEVIQISPEIAKNVTTGLLQNSAFDKVKDLIQQHTQYNEQISISCIPIYHLEPNTLIEINHDALGVHGHYLVKSISLPLTPNGTSNISATKCLQKTI